MDRCRVIAAPPIVATLALLACAARPPPPSRDAPPVAASVSPVASASATTSSSATTAAATAQPAPAPRIPGMVEGGSIACGTATCAAGREVCCAGECKSFTDASDASPSSGAIAKLCAGPHGDPRAFAHRTLVACNDSSQCERSAICCGAKLASSKMTPFGAEPFTVTRCTVDPAGDCADLELCEGPSCRAPRPNVSIPCGGKACIGTTPICRYDARDSAELVGTKRAAPTCTDASTPLATREHVVECLAQSDCPKGAQCVLFYFTTRDSSCVYKPTGSHESHRAPVCRVNGDCDALLARWSDAMSDEDRARAKSTRCVPVPGDPARRSTCRFPNLTPP